MTSSAGRSRTLALALALALAGCGGAARKNQESLADAIRSYNEGLRWQRFEVAANHVPPAERAAFVDAMDERAEDLEISEYELVKLEPRGAKEARVHVKIKWYLESEGTLRETHALQTWERRGPAWLMVDEVRLRGAEMPGLVNREKAAPDGGPAARDEGGAQGKDEATADAADGAGPTDAAAPATR